MPLSPLRWRCLVSCRDCWRPSLPGAASGSVPDSDSGVSGCSSGVGSSVGFCVGVISWTLTTGSSSPSNSIWSVGRSGGMSIVTVT